mmetsp:Transcript_26577/g.37686  ORF Transcript_26577/g.37686 Transcript_26577/m.37686 type:complete len:136 (+) Transcript_26577:344-751(+)
MPQEDNIEQEGPDDNSNTPPYLPPTEAAPTEEPEPPTAQPLRGNTTISPHPRNNCPSHRLFHLNLSHRSQPHLRPYLLHPKRQATSNQHQTKILQQTWTTNMVPETVDTIYALENRGPIQTYTTTTAPWPPNKYL